MTLWHRPDPTDLAVPLLAAAAAYITLVSWSGLSAAPGGYLAPLYWVALGVAVGGIVLRALRLPALLVPVLQLLGVFAVLHQGWTSGGLLGGWVPTPTSLALLGRVLEVSAETTTRYAAPVPAEEPMFAPLMVVVGAAVVLAVDLLAATLGRAPLAGLPLLAAFTVPVSLLDGVPWLTFALTAAAFLLLLAAEQAARLGQWGRRLGSAAGDGGHRPVRLGTLWPSAARLGAVGVGVAVLAPVLVPAGDGWFAGGDGAGIGGRGDRVTLENPFVDIRRDLVQAEDVPLVRAVTDDPDPSYLRLTVLDEFDGDRWRPSERHIPADHRAEGELPPPPGLQNGTPREEHAWVITVTERFATTWLPTPYPASSVVVDGDWRYDLDTLDLVSADGADAAGLTYRVEGLDLQPEPRALASAGAAGRSLAFDNTRLPETVPLWVEDLAEEVTDGSSSGFERAVRLQQWFRSDGGFEYSLEPDPGNGLDDLEQFLGTGPGSRVGYCEQFSAAMTLMARTLGIPARVAVGFLSPDRVEGGWEYSSRDLHAWPELYFEGAGWVRFEPTPPVRAGGAPGYTTVALPEVEETSAPSASAPTAQQTQGAPVRDESAAAVGDGGGGVLAGWLPWLLGLASLVVLGVLPRGVRAVVRRRRYAGSSAGAVVEGAWAEVRATALDLGRGWDDGETLRRRARGLVPLLGGGDRARAGAAALDRLVTLLERARYSRAGLAGEAAEEARASGAALGRTVCAALVEAARPSARRRATWLPASLWRSRAQGTGGSPGPGGRAGDRAGEAWEGAGAPEREEVAL